ncbi:Bug family tripartite tricarboxylate transporter substrate binding protein [Muricoccus aerilatus]|uniref:Bug family tripartite tricarboxylate transporter substrate binding protein n=1 Tax=Muricoccus aerilatus TaxID=452982 RepID=UPI0005C2081F|nr:tripartite tricarboxylate transporter substrate binding protein [Roseomonas aerilata]
MKAWTRRGSVLAAALLLAGRAARAAWPERPVRLIAPYAPGGVTDILARSLTQVLSPRLGQPVVIENRPGANTIVGTQAAAGAVPDGHSLLLTSGAGFVVNPLLYSRLPYDPSRDFSLLSIVAESPLIMVVDARSPLRTVDDFIAFARARPGGANYASVGQGSPVQLASEMFAMMTGLSMVHVPYGGSAPAQIALMAGDVQVMFDALGSASGPIRDGRLRALAVTGGERSEAFPNVPTMMEAGLPNYRVAAWFGIAAPRQVPAPVQERLREALAAAQGDGMLAGRLRDLGMVPQPPRDAAAVAAYLAEDHARWKRVIEERGLSLSPG